MINVVGLGYIGLPTALMLASHGTEVSSILPTTSLAKRLTVATLWHRL